MSCYQSPKKSGLISFFILIISVLSNGSLASPNNQNGQNVVQDDFLDCILLEAAIQFEDGSHQTKLHCQEVRPNKKGGKIFELDNMPKGLMKAFENSKAKHVNPYSSNIRLRVNNVNQGNGRLRFHQSSDWSVHIEESVDAPSGSSSEGVTDSSQELISYAAESKSVLAVRVVAPDDATTASASTLSNKIFGTSGDLVNLKSQMLECSHNQIDFIPAVGTNIVNGVVTVNLSINVQGVSDGTVRNAVTAALEEQYGISGNAYDHIMYVLPGSVSMGIAYAYINHYLSVYKNNWGTYPSAQMHEIGHNLNLAHSSQDSDTYGDQTGMMGYSYSSDDGPLMCFNGAKSAQLGWYQTQQISLNAGEDWSGQISGIVDFQTTNTPNIVKILSDNGTGDALYVTLNAKKDFNSGTQEAGDLVTVTQKSSNESSYSQSFLNATLASSAVYVANNFGGDNSNVTIRVNSIYTTNTGLNYYYADVDVFYNDVPPTANDVSVTTPYGTSVSFDLSGQGSGVLTYSIVASPINGLVSLAGKTATYTPNTGFSGSDSFTYIVISSAGESNTATAYVEVLQPLPSTPTGLASSDTGSGQVVVVWNDTLYETHYQLERQKYSTKGRNSGWSRSTLIDIMQADATSFAETLNNGQYRYRIKSINSAGESSWSAWSEVTVSSNVDNPNKGKGKKNR